MTQVPDRQNCGGAGPECGQRGFCGAEFDFGGAMSRWQPESSWLACGLEFGWWDQKRYPLFNWIVYIACRTMEDPIQNFMLVSVVDSDRHITIAYWTCEHINNITLHVPPPPLENVSRLKISWGESRVQDLMTEATL